MRKIKQRRLQFHIEAETRLRFLLHEPINIIEKRNALAIKRRLFRVAPRITGTGPEPPHIIGAQFLIGQRLQKRGRACEPFTIRTTGDGGLQALIMMDDQPAIF